MKMIRFKGSLVVLGTNQAMKMLLAEAEQPQGRPMHSRPVYVGGVVSPIFSSHSSSHLSPAPDAQGAD